MTRNRRQGNGADVAVGVFGRRCRVLLLLVGALALQLASACVFDRSGLSDGSPRAHFADGAVVVLQETSVEDGGRDETSGGSVRDGAAADVRDAAMPPADANALPDARAMPDVQLADARPDTAQSPDVRPADVQPADARPADVGPDAAPGVYVDEAFDHSPGQLVPRRGSWSIANGGIIQSDTTLNGAVATVDLAVNNYRIETALVIYGIEGVGDVIEGAGLAARFQEVQPATGDRIVAQYACMVTPEDKGYVIIGKASGNTGTYGLLKWAHAYVPYDTGIRLRFTLRSDRLVCELPDQGISIETNEGSYASGAVGLVTIHADTFFEYFLATAPDGPSPS